MADTSSNPLLDLHDVPLFDRIQPEHVAPAMDQLLAETEAALETVVAPQFPAAGRPSPARSTSPPNG